MALEWDRFWFYGHRIVVTIFGVVKLDIMGMSFFGPTTHEVMYVFVRLVQRSVRK